MHIFHIKRQSCINTMGNKQFTTHTTTSNAYIHQHYLIQIPFNIISKCYVITKQKKKIHHFESNPKNKNTPNTISSQTQTLKPLSQQNPNIFFNHKPVKRPKTSNTPNTVWLKKTLNPKRREEEDDDKMRWDEGGEIE